jgi:hypothetical protein
VNNLLAGPVLPGMRIHRQNGLPGSRAGREEYPTETAARRLRWRPRRRRDRGDARRAPGTDAPGVGAVPGVKAMRAVEAARAVRAAPGETMADAMQLAIGLLTAGLDSPELEAWAADALIPPDADGLGNLMVGLHVVSVLLLHELHEETEEPQAAILQRLAMLAEDRRGKPFAG